jgi:glycosyltransferase involved in cell wall biosynthesis
VTTSPPRPRRIDQFVPTYMPHDAIGNHAAQMQRLLREQGFESDIYTEYPNAFTGDGRVHFRKYPYRGGEAIVIYHHSIESRMVDWLQGANLRTVIDYHNVTPPEHFWHSGELHMHAVCKRGIQQVGELRGFTRHAWTESLYNMRDLRDAGFEAPRLVPIFRHYDRLHWQPHDPRIAALEGDGRPVILFVGRVAANKGQLDLVKFLAAYYRIVPARPRLLLVGGAHPPDKARLAALAAFCGLSLADSLDAPNAATADVVLTGSVSDGALATAYRVADLYLSFSEHEGFGVPLVEAMTYGVPVVAHDAAAVAETCADGAILVDKRRFEDVLAVVVRLLIDPRLHAARVRAGRRRAERFAIARLERDFRGVVEATIEDFSREPPVVARDMPTWHTLGLF